MTHAMAAKAPPGYGRNQNKRTSMKLWLAVVSANLIGLFIAVYVSSYLRIGAGNPDVLFPLYYAAIALAGIVDAFWLDEVLFKGSFRRTLQGKTGRFMGKNADVDDIAASLQTSSISFPIVVWCAASRPTACSTWSTMTSAIGGTTSAFRRVSCTTPTRPPPSNSRPSLNCRLVSARKCWRFWRVS